MGDEALAIIVCARHYVKGFIPVFKDFLNFAIEAKIRHALYVYTKCWFPWHSLAFKNYFVTSTPL